MTRIGFGLAAMVAIAMSAGCSSSDDGGGGTTADSAVGDAIVDDSAKTDTAVGDAPTSDSVVSDSTTTDAPAMDSPADGGACGVPAPACNTIVVPASATLVTGTVGTIPTFTAGGTIPDGVYVLTKEILESGTPKPSKQVVSITGTCLQAVTIDADGKEVRANGTGDLSGGTATFAFTCPAAFTQHPSYGRKDAAGGKVTLITLSDPSLGPKTYREWIQQ